MLDAEAMAKPGSFGHWMRHRRRELDLTQDALAGQVGCARITIRKLEDGQLRPSKELARLILERLGISPEEREHFVRYAREEFLPPSLSGHTPPHNIPSPISGFVGREREVAIVKKLVRASRLVTVSGAGGMGKTRFGMVVARELLGSFKDGVWWVELAALGDPALVIDALARVLRVTEIPTQPLAETLVHSLRPKQLLLVLDNCEHLTEACALAAEKILTACANVRILTTSREALGITGEEVYRMPTLSFPDALAPVLSETLMQYEAIQLFTQRATAVNQHFSLTNQNALEVLQICRRLDGMPLAIELAAARVKTLSPRQIVERLDDRFTLLSDPTLTAPSRHQTLRAALDWSHGLLVDAERLLFRQLAVFAGGFTLDMLAAVTRLNSNQLVLDVLSRLVDKSLVVVEYDDSTRYRLLETIRQYALEKLQAFGEVETLRDQHLDCFLSFAQATEPHLFDSGQKDWMKRLELEHDNLRGALTWAFESGQVTAGLRLAGALARFWLQEGHLREGRQWLNRLLMEGDSSPATDRAKALYWASAMSRTMGDTIRAKDLAESSYRLYRELGDKRGVGLALTERGAVSHYEGNREQALECLNEGLQILVSTGEAWAIANSHLWLGDTWFRAGDIACAASHWDESLHLARKLGDLSLLAWSLGGLADVARQRGDYERAIEMLTEALVLYRGLGNKVDLPFTLEALGLVAAARGQSHRAARLWGAAIAWREAISQSVPSSYQADYAPYIAQVRGQLGDEAYSATWSEGYRMLPDQAIDYALRTEEDD
jgi:predicted ATPase/DNA-binding XRE family transcriptional regulator